MTPDAPATMDPWLVLALVMGVVSVFMSAYVWWRISIADDVIAQVQSSLRRHLEKRL